MSKRRTKEEKKQAHKRHESGVTYSYAAPVQASKPALRTATGSSIALHDPQLIKKDLLKTIGLSTGIILLELLFYFYLR